MCNKKLSVLMSILSVIAVFSSDTKAKSVCAITDHGYPDRNAKIAAYGIEGKQIYGQYVYELDQTDYPTGATYGPERPCLGLFFSGQTDFPPVPVFVEVDRPG